MMGFYINPPVGTKEDWLSEHAEPIHNPKWPPRPREAIICLVFNPNCTAAAIAYSEEEFDAYIIDLFREIAPGDNFIVGMGDNLPFDVGMGYEK